MKLGPFRRKKKLAEDRPDVNVADMKATEEAERLRREWHAQYGSPATGPQERRDA